LPEGGAKGEVNKVQGQVINRVIELTKDGKVGEGGREVVNGA
jgi:hypothetical protein